MSSTQYRIAPPGFTTDQWDEFMEEGFLTFEDALSPDDVQFYLDAIDEMASADSRYEDGKHYGPGNVVERHKAFADLIDHPRHVGYAYDIYGELLKLHISQVFIRPKGGPHNIWHPDGARSVPYGVFAPELPLQLKVGYWLTDVPRPKMGNFVYMPGSHFTHYMDGYDTHRSLPGERIVTVRAGTMTLMHANTWHRVEPNESDVTRKNIFYAYCPSWVCEGDRLKSDPEWLKTLNREQRIIMRSYDGAYTKTKPPESDSPLFLDRETGSDADPGSDETVALNRRKRMTWVEKRMGSPYNGALSHRFEKQRLQRSAS
ncbi:MAG: phytanoyl-CoA dioxygenase family protein [Candidatus Poribacteria bacterium]|nr:phytanoyl-CoA dioxygenase family protein [Candidatus Poribacteria bacterium]